MTRVGLVCVAMVLAMLAQSACLPNDNGSGGGGGPGTFSNGFVFVRRDDRNLYLVDRADYTHSPPDFSKIIKLTTNGGNSQPSFSKDASRIAFVHTDGAQTEIDVIAIAAAGTAPTLVMRSDSQRQRLRNPVFSPDGSLIAFAYDGAGGASYLGTVGINGSLFQQVTSGPRSYGGPSFYPNGTDVLAIAGDSSSFYNTLERINLNTFNRTIIAPTLGGASSIANRVLVSPDGSKAAFDGRLSGGGSRIFVVQDLSSATITQMTEYDASAQLTNDTFPTWVPNNSVGFSSDFGNSDGTYVLPASSLRAS